MRKSTFLFSILFFLCVINFSVSYTVVLKSGKTVEGKWIAEDQYTVQIHDAQGTFLSLKKSSIDLQATSNANRQPATQSVQPVAAASRSVSLADLAEQTKKQRTGKARTVTQKDLRSDAAVSIFGSQEAPGLPTEKSAMQMPNADERYWRGQAEKIKRELLAAEEKKRQAEAECYQARNANNIRVNKRRSNEVLILQSPQEPRECGRAREAEARWNDANERWQEFQERARRQSVPWQWLD